MANPERGESRLVVGAHTYTLRLTTNSCCECEDYANGRTWDQVLLGMQKGSIRDVRFFLWAALREHHPDLASDKPEALKAIGNLIDEAGGVKALFEQVKAVADLNADTGEDPVAKGAPTEPGARPPDAAGTGAASTLTPSVAA